MKGKLFAILALVLILSMSIPMTVFAASNTTTLNKLKLAGVKKYDTALPTKGTSKTEKQINKLLSKIKYKPSGKGNTSYWYDLNFGRQVTEAPGTYDWASASKGYYKYDSKKKRSYYYSESRDIVNPKNGTSCYLSLEDAKYDYSYNWIKGEKKGTYYKTKKTTGGGGSSPKRSKYTLYSDVKILGEKCMVYSYYTKAYNETTYQYVSRKTGVTLKYVNVSPYSIYTSINFETKNVNKANSFFDVPKKVKFTLQKDAEPRSISIPDAILSEVPAA